MYLEMVKGNNAAKEKVIKGKSKPPISLLVPCFWPQSVATHCLFVSPSLLVRGGPRLGDGLVAIVDSH